MNGLENSVDPNYFVSFAGNSIDPCGGHGSTSDNLFQDGTLVLRSSFLVLGASFCVLRSACLVLGASCFVLRAWCFVLGAGCFVLVLVLVLENQAGRCAPRTMELHRRPVPFLLVKNLSVLAMMRRSARRPSCPRERRQQRKFRKQFAVRAMRFR